MPSPRGKRIALLAGTVTVLALAVAAVASKERLREEWYIWRLSSTDPGARYQAADALVAMKSIQGAREMVRILKEKRCQAVLHAYHHGREQAVYLVDPLGYGLFHIYSAKPEILFQEQYGMPQALGIISIMEDAKSRPVEVVSIGSPNWRVRYPFSRRLPFAIGRSPPDR